MTDYDVIVIGGGPAGLAAALASKKEGASTLIIERERRIGGILKQCIHDGFGVIRFGEKLSGPEYAERFIRMVFDNNINVLTSTYVNDIDKVENEFKLRVVNSKSGVFEVSSRSLVLACGCRERTSKQIFIQGDRPAGIFTAGSAQYFTNIMGYLPCKRCVILGSGDIGLIMARRLTLEGAEVIGVYEVKSTPSGLNRNISQCLDDFDIPLHLSHTITRIFGNERVEAVEIMKVDSGLRPIPGTENIVECDGVILSVGLIPENEVAEKLEIEIDRATGGPYVDQNFMTTVNGVFSCGNALHVNDLVDYVSESGEIAGNYAAKYSMNEWDRKLINIVKSDDFLYVVPQKIDISSNNSEIIIYFRAKGRRENTVIKINSPVDTIFKKRYLKLSPPEMERIAKDISEFSLDIKASISMVMEGD